MRKYGKKILFPVITISVLVLTYAVIFYAGMRHYEDEPVSFTQSIQVVIESITTAGFGGFAPWETGLMNLFVVIMNLTGVVLVFIALPAVLVPVMEKSFKNNVKTSTSETQHIIICGYSDISIELIYELEESGIPYVVIDNDKETCLEKQNDINIIYGDARKVETLRNGNIKESKAIVVDTEAKIGTEIILATREVNNDAKIISTADDKEESEYHYLAGADNVIEGRDLLSESLVNKALNSFADELSSVTTVDASITLTEAIVTEKSGLVGKRLHDTEFYLSINKTVIGLWRNGKFIISPNKEETLERNDVLLVAGEKQNIKNKAFKSRKQRKKFNGEKIVIAGYGELGRKIEKRLEEYNCSITTIDADENKEPDIVGDITKKKHY